MTYLEFLSSTTLSKRDLLALSHGSCIDDPPSSQMGLLPAPPMLMLDRVVAITHAGSRGSIVGEQDIDLDDWFFQCHFRSDPVQPGCLGVDAVWQLLAVYCMLRGAQGMCRALGCKEVEFFGQIRPLDSVVRYEVEVRRYSEQKSTGTGVVVGNARVLVDGQHIYTIKDAKVGTFMGLRYDDYPKAARNGRGGVTER